MNILLPASVGAGIWSVGGNITAAWKEDVRLPCEMVGNPEPNITWKHQNKLLGRFHNNKLVII